MKSCLVVTYCSGIKDLHRIVISSKYFEALGTNSTKLVLFYHFAASHFDKLIYKDVNIFK